MQVKNLYVKGSVHSIVPLEEYNRIAYRVIADEGMSVTLNGTNLYPAIDVDSADGWYLDMIVQVTLHGIRKAPLPYSLRGMAFLQKQRCPGVLQPLRMTSISPANT